MAGGAVALWSIRPTYLTCLSVRCFGCARIVAPSMSVIGLTSTGCAYCRASSLACWSAARAARRSVPPLRATTTPSCCRLSEACPCCSHQASFACRLIDSSSWYAYDFRVRSGWRLSGLCIASHAPTRLAAPNLHSSVSCTHLVLARCDCRYSSRSNDLTACAEARDGRPWIWKVTSVGLWTGGRLAGRYVRLMKSNQLPSIENDENAALAFARRFSVDVSCGNRIIPAFARISSLCSRKNAACARPVGTMLRCARGWAASSSKSSPNRPSANRRIAFGSANGSLCQSSARGYAREMLMMPASISTCAKPECLYRISTHPCPPSLSSLTSVSRSSMMALYVLPLYTVLPAGPSAASRSASISTGHLIVHVSTSTRCWYVSSACRLAAGSISVTRACSSVSSARRRVPGSLSCEAFSLPNARVCHSPTCAFPIFASMGIPSMPKAVPARRIRSISVIWVHVPETGGAALGLSATRRRMRGHSCSCRSVMISSVTSRCGSTVPRVLSEHLLSPGSPR